MTLVMVGGGPERVDSRTAGPQPGDGAEGGLRRGHAARRYAHSICRRRYLRIYPTTDTQGMVITEAMAAGLPVVAVKAYGSETSSTMASTAC